MKQFDLQPGAVLLLGVLLFVLQPMELLALFLAALVHELGHLLMLRILGIRILGITISMTGPVLNCEPGAVWFESVLSALAGPVAGFLLWMLAGSCWPLLSEISLFLSVFNLIPVLPLDGGRMLIACLAFLFGDPAAETVCGWISAVLCVGMLFGGLLAAVEGYGITFAVFAGWMAVLACQAQGIVVE